MLSSNPLVMILAFFRIIRGEFRISGNGVHTYKGGGGMCGGGGVCVWGGGCFTKLFHFHRLIKNGGGGGSNESPLDPPLIIQLRKMEYRRTFMISRLIRLLDASLLYYLSDIRA